MEQANEWGGVVKVLEVWKTVKHATWGMNASLPPPQKFYPNPNPNPNNHDCPIRVCDCSIKASQFFATRHASAQKCRVVSTTFTEYIYHQF